MSGQTAVLLGASGLTGSHVLEALLTDDSFSGIRVLVRRPLPINHPKLETVIVDFSNYDEFKKKLGTADCIFCCIGTTLSKVKGDKMEYRKIDFDIPVNAARFGAEAGVSKFLLVSSHLANSKSFFFYPRLKGETEEVVQSFPFKSVHIFRPSFLMGARKEKRWPETIAGKLMQSLSFLLNDASKPIDSMIVARAMVEAAKKDNDGLQYYYYKDMKQLTRNE